MKIKFLKLKVVYKKILITGSNGLVGSTLVRYLKESDYNVIPSTRKDTNLFSFEETKILINNTKPDLIINCAAKVGGILANNTYRSDFILENLKINMNLLEALKEVEPLRFINLGSSCIYPLNAPNPIKEEYIMEGKLEQTNSPYAMAKLTSIEIGDAISKEYGHNITNLMPTNLYGPGDNFDENNSHVIPGLISRLNKAKNLNSEYFHVWGTGKPLREFLYSIDFADAVKFIIENKINDNLINVGSGEEVSIFELVKIIKRIIDFKGELLFDSNKPDGNPRKLLDSSKINNLGWKPKYDLEKGIQETYKWYLNTI